jgi:hypothetical protein
MRVRPSLRAVLTGHVNMVGGEWELTPLPSEQQPAYGQTPNEFRCAFCGHRLSSDDASLVLLAPIDRDDWHTLPHRERAVTGEAIAAFGFKQDFEHYHMLVRRLSDPEMLLQDLLRYYTRQQERVDLAGEDVSPLADFVSACEKILPDAISMRDHRHSWSDDGYCRICTRDGRA